MNRFIIPLCLLCLIPLPGLAQDAGGPPGLRSLEISDDAIDALYKLRSGAGAADAPADEPTDNMADQPSGQMDKEDKKTKDDPSNPKSPAPADAQKSSPPASTVSPSPESVSTDPNIQSHSLTFIPDGAEDTIKDQKSGSPLSQKLNNKNNDVDTEKKDKDSEDQQSSQGANDNKSPLDEKIFTPTAKLKPWDKRSTLYGLGQNTDKIRAALIVFSSEPEYANPQTLMDVSALYAQVGDYKTAARYYYVANLRRAFDTVRFPSSKIPPLNGGTWGESVGAWVAASSARMQNVINDMRAWDERIPYRYHPGYRVSEGSINTPVPSESEWAEILDTTRTDFFKSVSDMSQALGRMGK